jgi:hypothetical protein
MADLASGISSNLQNIQTLEPGEQDCFYETHDFSNDGKRLLISGNLVKGQVHTGLDIYEMDIASRKVKRLTHTDNDWDEHALYSPEGTMIAWMSSTGSRWKEHRCVCFHDKGPTPQFAAGQNRPAVIKA